jgi:N-acetylglucosamine-6-phosphate deacetylase
MAWPDCYERSPKIPQGRNEEEELKVKSVNQKKSQDNGVYRFQLSTSHFMLLHAKHYATARSIALTIEDGRIATVAESDQNPSFYIAPAFFDPQINGCLGISFNSPTLTQDEVRIVVDECRKHGIGVFLPTLITGSFEAIQHGFKTLTKARDADPILERCIPGFHLEGPYLSAEDGPRGAHPREHARNPDWDEFRRWQDAANGLILMVTVAPERPGMLEFIEKLTAAGIVVAIGHTAATAQQIRDAVAAGARTTTHLGNGCHAVLPRHDNYIWEQLANDDLWASIIADGHHLPPAVVKCFVRGKGVARTLLTCDAGSLAGMPAGKYREWGTELEVLPGGKIVVAGTPYLAGSGHFTDMCVGNVIRFAGVSLAEAVHMATVHPRQLLDLPIHTLDAGQPAELVLFEWREGEELRVVSML